MDTRKLEIRVTQKRTQNNKTNMKVGNDNETR